MDTSPSTHSPDVTESRTGFRRSATDVSRRNYRRHSPSSSRSPSPPCPDGPKLDRSLSHHSQEGGLKRGKRAAEGSEAGRGDTEWSRRGHDAGLHVHKSQHYDRYGRSDDGYKHDRRHTGHHDRNHHNHSLSSISRDSYTSSRSDHYHNDGRRHTRADPRSPEKTVEGTDRRNENRSSERDRDRDRDRSDRYRGKDREIGPGGAKSGSKRLERDLDMEIGRSRDPDIRLKDEIRGKEYRNRDHHGGKDFWRDKNESIGDDEYKEIHESKVDKERMKERLKEYHCPRDRKDQMEGENAKGKDDYGTIDVLMRKEATEDCIPNCHTSDADEDAITSSGGTEDYFGEKSGALQDDSKERERAGKASTDDNKMDYVDSVTALKSEDASIGDHCGSAVTADNSLQESAKTDANTHEKPVEETKSGPEAENFCNDLSEAEIPINDFNNAKMAALRAAELVNKNLGASGFMSADQKKRLLWGSKNQDSSAASGTNRWDTVHFGDQDRQQKFNKLMGVKGEASVESEKGGSDGSRMFTTEKQQELQQDLENQFSAGLRRRDGRTVGLGL